MKVAQPRKSGQAPLIAYHGGDPSKKTRREGDLTRCRNPWIIPGVSPILGYLFIFFRFTLTLPNPRRTNEILLKRQ